MDIESRMKGLVAALPNATWRGNRTVREACLALNEDGVWSALAGGHSAVHIGEYGGDYQGSGATAEEAIAACMVAIIAGPEEN